MERRRFLKGAGAYALMGGIIAAIGETGLSPVIPEQARAATIAN